MTGPQFGHIPGYPVGSTFESRKALSEAGVHRPTQAGIGGSQHTGADSIVLSGGYEDDQDYGHTIFYTGEGGRDPQSGRQVRHQRLRRGNQALAKSAQDGLPVRVIRRVPADPKTGSGFRYRYDGLYRVERGWKKPGRSGFDIWQFKLVSYPGLEANESANQIAEPGTKYHITTIQRIVRDTEMARKLKRLYDYRCQVCGIRLEGAAGPYAEAAHIRPLGAPRHGPDTRDNLLCLCPNHHVLFDYHGFTIADDLSLIGIEGILRVHPRHRIDPAHLAYHRTHHFHERASDA